MAESFFAALKNERVHRTVYPTRQHAKDDITRYIELRLQYPTSPLGVGLQDPTCPREVYTEYLNQQHAA